MEEEGGGDHEARSLMLLSDYWSCQIKLVVFLKRVATCMCQLIVGRTPNFASQSHASLYDKILETNGVIDSSSKALQISFSVIWLRNYKLHLQSIASFFWSEVQDVNLLMIQSLIFISFLTTKCSATTRCFLVSCISSWLQVSNQALCYSFIHLNFLIAYLLLFHQTAFLRKKHILNKLQNVRKGINGDFVILWSFSLL